MWFLIVLPLAFLGGVMGGYIYTHKKRVPSFEFVKEKEKEKILAQHKVQLGESSVCKVCGDKVTIQNIGMVIPREQETTFICSRQQCMTVGGGIAT